MPQAAFDIRARAHGSAAPPTAAGSAMRGSPEDIRAVRAWRRDDRLVQAVTVLIHQGHAGALAAAPPSGVRVPPAALHLAPNAARPTCWSESRPLP